MQPKFPPRRFVPFSKEMSEKLEELHLAYPEISRARITADALRRGMEQWLAMGTPTLMPQNVAELRRVS